ncbi:MAG TPA: alpha/beta fold hydrolase [Bacteroidia bacterium]|nr:alpha/beta fold hydrolase [Bacteroidia bacterium]HNU32771.1 alpha/beta fold hydrolase [Bacteroidia bacterium]
MKQKIILLHGALGDASMFNGLIKLLEKDFKIFSFNFSGHAKKDFTDKNFSIQLFADELEEFILANNIGAANIFGYSMGGYVVWWLARFKPTLVQFVFTLATKLNWNEETSAKENRMLNANKMEEKIPAYALLLKERHGDYWKKTVTQTAELILQLGKYHLVDDDFKRIKARVHFSIGDKDTMVTKEETLHFQSLIEHSSYSVLENTQHAFEKVDDGVVATEIVKVLHGN